MKRNKEVSAMQEEVWRMKARVCRETKDMGAKEFFRYIKKQSQKLTEARDRKEGLY